MLKRDGRGFLKEKIKKNYSIKNLRKWSQEIESSLHTRVSPIGVKMLKNRTEVPKGAIIPSRDWGRKLSLCQAYAKCRREVITIAEFKEDMWCFEPVIGLGFADRVSYFLDGHHHYPDNTRTLEAGRNWASHMPCFEYGKYQGIVISPIKSINFIPDILILYINPLQLTHLLITKNWIDGFDVTCSLSGHAACVYSTVPAIQRQQCWVTSPCKGDRRIAMAQDDEIIFSFPVDMLRNIVTGLKHLEDHNVRLPYPLEYSLEYDLKPEYAKIGKMLGMNLGKSDDPKLRPRSTSKNKQ